MAPISLTVLPSSMLRMRCVAVMQIYDKIYKFVVHKNLRLASIRGVSLVFPRCQNLLAGVHRTLWFGPIAKPAQDRLPVE